MRPDEVFRVRIENIDFVARQIFNPNGKTKASRRYVPMSQRMLDMLLLRKRKAGCILVNADN